MIVFFRSQSLGTLIRPIFGARKSAEKFNSIKYRGEIAVWCTWRVNVVVLQFDCNHEILSGGDCYQMVETYIRSEAWQFPQTAFHSPDLALHPTKRAVRSLLDAVSWNLWIARYGQTRCPEKSRHLTPPHVLLLGFVKDQAYQTFVPILSQIEQE